MYVCVLVVDHRMVWCYVGIIKRSLMGLATTNDRQQVVPICVSCREVV